MARRAVDVPAVEHACRMLLQAIGEDPDREGLRDTPRRWAAWWSEFIDHDPGVTDTAFTSSQTDQMVVISGMKVFSLCEHHMIPFWCDVSVAYITRDQILGLSKFARIAHSCSHRLQVQERLAEQIADAIEARTGSPDVAVLLRGQHLCMLSRGVRTPGLMTSSVMRGTFREKADARAEFLALAVPAT